MTLYGTLLRAEFLSCLSNSVKFTEQVSPALSVLGDVKAILIPRLEISSVTPACV